MKKQYLLAILFFCLVWAGKAQNNTPRFENFTTEHGLGQNNVQTMYQDMQGFMWFGTGNGLSRYDGYRFVTYKNNLQDQNSLLDNYVVRVTGDTKDNLWILTAKGLTQFHVPTGKFTRFASNKNNINAIPEIEMEASHIFVDKQGRVWVNGVYIIDKVRYEGACYLETKTGKIQGIYEKDAKDNPHSIKNRYRHGNFSEDAKGNIYVGVVRINIEKSAFENLAYEPEITAYKDILGLLPEEIEKWEKNPANVSIFTKALANLYFWHSVADKHGNIWGGDQTGHIFCFSLTTRKLVYYPYDHNTPATIKSMCIDEATQTLYVGLYGLGGVLKIDLAAEHTFNATQVYDKYNRLTRHGFIKSETWHHHPADVHSLGIGTATGIFKDRSGCVWIGIADHGIYKYAPYTQKFDRFSTLPRDTNTLITNTITSFYRAKNKQLYVGTVGGLQTYIAKENRFQRYRLPKSKEGRHMQAIYSTVEDDKNNFYLGTWGLGTYLYNPKTGAGKFLSHDKTKDEFDQPLAWVQKLYWEEKQNKLWVCLWGGGIGYIDLATEKVWVLRDIYNAFEKAGKPVPEDKKQIYGLSRTFLPTHDGNFWIGHDREEPFRLFNTTTFQNELVFQASPHKDSLHSTTIGALIYDEKKQLWAGTMNGLSLYNPTKKTWKTYSTAHGIPNENINGILQDKQGYLWLLTGNGLCKFDKEKGRAVLVLTTHDGLPTNELTTGYQDEEGTFYIGTVKGFISFNPEKLRFNPIKPTVLLSQIELNNHAINADSLVFLSGKCYLKRTENDITFQLASSDFNLPTQNKFMLKLEGYDKHWVALDTRNIAIYTNLAQGNYILKVKCSNNDGLWSAEQTLLQFEILPAWYETWIARIAFLLLFVGLIALTFRQRIRHLEAKKLQLENMVEEKTKELQQQKAEITEKNEELQQQNEEISQQHDNLEAINEELNQQQEELKAVNDNLAEKNHEIGESIDAALMVQQAMLPHHEDFNKMFGQENYFILYKPHQGKVSGDFYFMEEKRIKIKEAADKYRYENCLFFLCADCTGHGIPGALMTMLGNELLHEIIQYLNIHEPAKILRRLHTEVRRTLHYKTSNIYNGMDLSVIVFYKAPQTKEGKFVVSKIEFAGAKSNLYYITDEADGVLQELKGDRKGIGGQDLQENEGVRSFETQILSLETPKNITLYLSSDGYYDQLGGAKNKAFGSKKMKELLQTNAPESMQAQKEVLENNHEIWKTAGHEIQTDDITLIGLRLTIVPALPHA